MATISYTGTGNASEWMTWIELEGIGQLDTTQGNNKAEGLNDLLLGNTYGSSSLKLTQVSGIDNHLGGVDELLATNDYNNVHDYLMFDEDSSKTYEADVVGRATSATFQYTDSQGNTGSVTTNVEVLQVEVASGVYRTFLIPIDADSLDNLGSITSVTFNSFKNLDDSLYFGNRDIVGTVVCFTSGTLIKTVHGELPVEDLHIGTMVLTLDEGYQPIRWIGSNRLSPSNLEHLPNLRPIRIRAGALGDNQPAQDLMVSPQHRVLIRSNVARRMFGEREVFVAAKQLLALEGIEVAEDVRDVTYWHFMFDTHQVVFSNGAATESLFTGPEALKAVSPGAREEILTIFPDLAVNPKAGTPPARLLIPGRPARKLAERIARNAKSLVS